MVTKPWSHFDRREDEEEPRPPANRVDRKQARESGVESRRNSEDKFLIACNSRKHLNIVHKSILYIGIRMLTTTTAPAPLGLHPPLLALMRACRLRARAR